MNSVEAERLATALANAATDSSEAPFAISAYTSESRPCVSTGTSGVGRGEGMEFTAVSSACRISSSLQQSKSKQISNTEYHVNHAIVSYVFAADAVKAMSFTSVFVITGQLIETSSLKLSMNVNRVPILAILVF